MKTPILLLPLKSKRDILIARQRARQIAGLLGLDPREQTLLAAAVFEMACHAVSQFRTAEIRFGLVGNSFEITTAPERRVSRRKRAPRIALGQDSVVRIAKLLPDRSSAIAREDLAWVTEELAQVTPANLFAEIKQQNQELLRALHELQVAQEEMAYHRGQRRGTAAA